MGIQMTRNANGWKVKSQKFEMVGNSNGKKFIWREIHMERNSYVGSLTWRAKILELKIQFLNLEDEIKCLLQIF
jgi:hypothetical protein